MSTAQLKSTFLTPMGGMRLAKTFRANGEVEAYPNAKSLTSHERLYPITVEGMRQREKDMREFALKGGCLLRGNLIRQITDESRGGLTDSAAPNQTLMLDFDKITYNGSHFKKTVKKGKLDVEVVRVEQEDIIKAAETMIEFIGLPKDVSYFVHASNSMGMMLDKMSIHIEFVLSQALATTRQKEWIELQAVTRSEISKCLGLSKNKMTLTWPLDPSVAHNSKLIYIGNPTFELKDMNPVACERVFFVEKKKLLLDHNKIALVNGTQLEKLKEEMLTNLRVKEGLSKITPKAVTVRIHGETMRVFKNAERMSLDIAYEKGDFVYCNINGGDSHAYYFLKRDPTLMLNFKGEPAFRIKDANPEFHAQVCDIYREDIAKNEVGQRFLRRRSGEDGAIYGLILEEGTGELQTYESLTEKAAEDWCAQNEILMPDNIPFATIGFDPTEQTGRQMKFINGVHGEFINSYQIPETVRRAKTVDFIMSRDDCMDYLRENCPATTTLLLHVMAEDEVMMKHFVNWLACAAKYRTKNRTTFLFQGVQGTGKGIMYEEIIKPLMGAKYCAALTIQQLEEQFNGYIDEKLMILVDEFRHGDAQASKFLENKIKMYVSETDMAIRAMRTDVQIMRTYFNMIFFSNNYDAIRIPEGDRRLNVSPRQEMPLRMIFPGSPEQQIEEIGKMVEAIREESPIFVGAMLQMKADRHIAATVIENEAKATMQSASRTKGEDFHAAITSGNISYFFEAATASSIPEQRQALMAGLKGLMQAYDMQLVRNASSTTVPMRFFVPFYALAHDAKDTVAGFHFRKWCDRNNIKTVSGTDGTEIRIDFKRNDLMAQQIMDKIGQKAKPKLFGGEDELAQHDSR